jgi:hypothetical protein
MTTYVVTCSGGPKKKALVGDEGFALVPLRCRVSVADYHPLTSGVQDGDGGVDGQIDAKLSEQVAVDDRRRVCGKRA